MKNPIQMIQVVQIQKSIIQGIQTDLIQEMKAAISINLHQS